jgi:hypothetical protein
MNTENNNRSSEENGNPLVPVTNFFKDTRLIEFVVSGGDVGLSIVRVKFRYDLSQAEIKAVSDAAIASSLGASIYDWVRSVISKAQQDPRWNSGTDNTWMIYELTHPGLLHIVNANAEKVLKVLNTDPDVDDKTREINLVTDRMTAISRKYVENKRKLSGLEETINQKKRLFYDIIHGNDVMKCLQQLVEVTQALNDAMNVRREKQLDIRNIRDKMHEEQRKLYNLKYGLKLKIKGE